MKEREPSKAITAPAAPLGDRALPAFFYRLSAAAQRRYLHSDSIDRFELTPTPGALLRARALVNALGDGARPQVEAASRALGAELCHSLRVAPVPIEVRSVRPHNAGGELHGVFYPHTRPPLIVLWMRTARRHDVVKPKTFMRTLMHELVHYLDYAHLHIGNSFHTAGFFKRESFLVRMLWPIDQP